MAGDDVKHCAYIKPDGNRCGGFHQLGREFCFTHDPQKVKERADAVRKGALSQRLQIVAQIEGEPAEIVYPSKPLRLRKAGDIRRAIALVLAEIRTGIINLDKGRTLLYGLGVQIQAIRDLEAPERLEKLEQLLRERGLL